MRLPAAAELGREDDCYAYAASGTFCGGSNKSRQIV